MNTVSSFVMKSVVLSLDGPVATVRLNRPPLNVLDFQMIDELLLTLQALERRSEVIAIILSGSERVFSAGVDVAIHTPDQVPTMLQKFHGLIGCWLNCARSPLLKRVALVWVAGLSWRWSVILFIPAIRQSGVSRRLL